MRIPGNRIAWCCVAWILNSTVAFVLQPPPREGVALTRRCALEEDGPRKKKRLQNKKPRRFSQEAHSVAPPKPNQRSSSRNVPPQNDNTDFMLRSDKSIEELESIMTKRWGTRLDQWTADPSELEDEQPNKKKKSTFRGKPVLDPWQKEEKENEGGIFSKQDDAMLNRVRRNQERMQNKKRDKSEKQTPPRAKQELEKHVVAEKDVEFYDEDDEGYEPSNLTDEDDLYSMEHLINPKPVGGRGSTSIPAREERPSTGFFFNDNAATRETLKKEETPAEEAPSKPRPKSKKKRSRVVMGEDGHPLCLTVEQAQRDFEASLVVEGPEENGTATVYTPPVMRSWEEQGITSRQLLINLQNMGCGAPLSVQDKACPSILTGNDVLVGTYTGSGKTLAFLVPLAQRLLFTGASNEKQVQVVIVAPGRELASQIVSVARSLLEGTDLSVMLAIGGTTFGRNLEQIRKRKPSILVGTPGRIAELVVGRPGEKSGRLKVGSLQSLVLDEFDALLEYKPHRDPTNAIIQSLKRRHGDALQSILCSATASDMMKSPKLGNFLRPGYAQAMADQDDQLITSGEETESSAMTRVSRTVIHGAVHVPHRRFALETLRKILHTEPLPQQALIFTDSSHRVEILIDKLANMGIVAAPLHGGRGSEKIDRAQVSKALREGYVGIVVATEMAARGLDAPLLTHVINLDLPTDASHYAHRAGRCGRGGRPGVVINFTTTPKERNVPKRFAEKLGITMHNVEARSGKLVIVEPESQSVDKD